MLSTSERVQLFFSRLSVLIDQGIPLVSCIHLIAEEVSEPHWQSKVYSMANRLETGSVFYEVLGEDFSQDLVSVIQEGCKSGTLDQACEKAAAMAMSNL